MNSPRHLLLDNLPPAGFSPAMIGGMPETQEMLDYCATKNITSDIELISIKEINDAYSRMEKSDVRYRFVIDMAAL